MAVKEVNALSIAYEVIGDRGARTWAITPGGRFSMTSPGVRELAVELAERGNRVLIWDRPNCGSSDVCFAGPSESAMQADTLAALIRDLDLGPTVIAGGSGGARVSLLTAQRHPDVTSGLATWWISGGVHGLMVLAVHYCAGSLRAAWTGGMADVAALPEWAGVIADNPRNREIFAGQDRAEFIATMERWMAVYSPRADEAVPGLTEAAAQRIDVPALVFRSGESDCFHTRATSENLAKLLPNARLAEPPWGDTEWNDRSAQPEKGLFAGWPALAPQLHEWAEASGL